MLTKRKDGRFVKKITLPNGTEKYFYSSAKTERAAMAEINQKILKFEKKTISELFADVADAWNTEHRQKISDLNYRTYVRAAYNRALEHFGNYNISDISARDVDMYLRKLSAMQLSKNTISYHKNVLNMIFDFAILNNIVHNNPVSVVKLPPCKSPKPRKIAPDEAIEIVKNHYEGFDFFAYFVLYTGLRRSEALAITYDDIDFERKIITVDKKVRFDNNRPVLINETKTEHSTREVLLLDRVAEKIPPGKGFLFANDKGELLTERQFVNRWKQYKKKYGIDITPHQLRHGYATMLFEAGINDKDAQELMGHANIDFTRGVYTHIRLIHQQETFEKLNNFEF